MAPEPGDLIMTDHPLDLTTRTTVKDLQRHWGEIADQALVQPVIVTSNGRPRHVLMGVAEYQRLVTEARKTCLVRDLPEPLMMLLEEGLDQLRAPQGTPDGEDAIR